MGFLICLSASAICMQEEWKPDNAVGDPYVFLLYSLALYATKVWGHNVFYICHYQRRRTLREHQRKVGACAFCRQ